MTVEANNSDSYQKQGSSGLEPEFEALRLTYGLNDNPSWYLTLLMGFQHFIIMSSGCAFGVIILFEAACVQDEVDKSNLIASCFFVMGITTLVQCTLGTRLPIAQGPSIVFYPVAVGIMASDISTCPNPQLKGNGTLENGTTVLPQSGEQLWHSRIGQVAGTIAVGSIFQLLIGSTGVMSRLLRFVGPLVVAPTIFLIGFSIMGAVLNLCAPQFYLAMTCCVLIIAFTYALDKVGVPLPYFSLRHRRVRMTRCAIFSSLPILLSMVIMYLLCHVLTVTDVLPNNPEAWGYGGRTDVKSSAVANAGWFRMPHPLQFGRLSVNGPGVVAVSCAILVSIMESIGDYVTCAKFCGSASPVGFPMNRGITAEGFGCLVSALFGLPLGPTSYSNNIAAISMTKVASRRVMQATSAILLLFGLFPKLSALFVCIPDPIIGGVLLSTIGIICGVAAGSLRSVRMDRPRNAFVFGFSVFLGVVVPLQIKASRQHRQDESVMISIMSDLLSNEMLVGTSTALLLDCLLPGTRKERGLEDDQVPAENGAVSDDRKQAELRRQVDCYESAAFHRFYSRRLPFLHRLPLFPASLPTTSETGNCRHRETRM